MAHSNICHNNGLNNNNTKYIIYSINPYSKFNSATYYLTTLLHRILLIACGENTPHFSKITLQLQKLFGEFFMWILWTLIKVSDRESYFGNKGKDVKHQNFYTTNPKQ